MGPNDKNGIALSAMNETIFHKSQKPIALKVSLTLVKIRNLSEILVRIMKK